MSSGIVFAKTGRSRTGAVVLALGLVLTVMLAIAPHALAVHDLDFQLEGNTAVDSAAATDPAYDWETFFNAGSDGNIHSTGTLPSGFTAAGFATSGSPAQAGDYYLPDETTFATGSKDTLNITPGWQCKKSNNVGDKVDIINAYSAVYTDSTGDTILYFGIEKSSPNGDSNVAVWFLQDSAVGCDATGGGNKSFTGTHTEGDLLLVSAFTNGGTVANVAAYAWVDGDASGHIDPNPVATGGLCLAPGTGDPVGSNACAITNGSAITPPWNHPDKDGGALNGLEFFEGGVNLTDAGILDACFARFLANTRSSQSLTATIFDYATGSLETCAPSTDLTVSGNQTIHSGDSVTVTINEENDGINPLTSPSVTVTSSTSENCSTPTYSSGDSLPTGVLDPGETWVYTCTIAPTADVTLTFTGHGTDPRGKDVSWDATDCVGKNEGDVSIGGTRVCDIDEVGGVSLDVTNPSTNLTADVTATFTFYETNDGDVNLTSVSVTGTGCTTSPTLAADTYNVGDTANPKGTLNVNETWVYTCSVTRTSSGTTDVSAIGSGNEGSTQITFCATETATRKCDTSEDAGGSVTLLSSAD
jgi:hypothetical protein